MKFVKFGLDRANKKNKKPCFIKSIGYIPDDTKDYTMYENIVYDIIEHLNSGKEFKIIDKGNKTMKSNKTDKDKIYELEQFEWHDLQLSAFSIKENSINFTVTPYEEKINDYLKFELILSEFTNVSFDIQSKCSLETLSDLEITAFSFTIQEQKITGQIDIISSNKAYWIIKFENATWQLNQLIE